MVKRVNWILVSLVLTVVSALASGPGSGEHGSGRPSDFHGHGGFQIEHNLVLPQIAVGKDISTTLVISSQANSELMPWLEVESC